jgi:hypothetical protein
MESMESLSALSSVSFLILSFSIAFLQQDYMVSTGLAAAATPATQTLKAEVCSTHELFFMSILSNLC